MTLWGWLEVKIQLLIYLLLCQLHSSWIWSSCELHTSRIWTSCELHTSRIWTSCQVHGSARFCVRMFSITLRMILTGVGSQFLALNCHWNLQGKTLSDQLCEGMISVTLRMMLTGVGSQFLALATGILMMALLGMFNVHRHGAINSAAIVLYAFTSCE